MELEMWEVVHIPDKPQIAPNQQPTVNVLAAVIEPKLTNVLIRRLNQIAPLENLRHLKRVQKKLLEGGKIQLSVILCVASDESNESCSMPHDVQELINSYQLSVFQTKVCQYAALSKEEWEEQCKLWPTSYHPPTYNIDGITGFSKEDSQSIFIFMNMAIHLAISGNGLVVNAAVIVDPLVKQVVATAYDQVCSWDIEADKVTLETNCLRKPAALDLSTDSEGMVSHKTLPSTCLQDETKQLYTGVSCLYPWRWAEQQPVHSSGCWHPLRHAAMVAIESSAARDRLLFPSSGDIQDTPIDVDNKQYSMGSPAKKQKTNIEKIAGNGIKNICEEDSHSLSARPYLCTGYDIYLVWEPCTMCAMALVHQRIRRIFYAFPNPNAGALGSVYRLQGERSLNHHYAVFRVMVPEQVLDGAHHQT
ncbi:tRNA-specific adenosine deaminase TAD3 [Humulus lupulus]|uniref:tRNA-specific adenosine deaminase TAD3 n=1 Tax=Humulus lupulus TaxID=3486 RepID=UPI002B4056C7|nr:tRNA-specific adenosine deaminase TAD3 [Humulus lupulus]